MERSNELSVYPVIVFQASEGGPVDIIRLFRAN